MEIGKKKRITRELPRPVPVQVPEKEPEKPVPVEIPKKEPAKVPNK